MNDNIFELIEQSKIAADERYAAVTSLPNWDEHEQIWLQHYSEKLVHLVVWECAGIYQRIDNGNLHMGTDDYIEALNRTFWDDEE